MHGNYQHTGHCYKNAYKPRNKPQSLKEAQHLRVRVRGERGQYPKHIGSFLTALIPILKIESFYASFAKRAEAFTLSYGLLRLLVGN